MTTERIRVLLVDDHTIVRQGLRCILATDEEIEVVGEAGDGRSAVELADRLQPDVVLMDLTLPELNGIEATRRIFKQEKDAKVLILTMHTDRMFVRQSLKAGARGYLVKDAEDTDLVKAVKVVGRGGSFFNAEVSRMLLNDYLGDQPPGDDDDLTRLTGREREILQLIAEGRTNSEIATTLSLSLNTVETHRKQIMKKLDLHKTAELVRFALRKQVVN
jgi:two-component system response regulator NreC